MSSPASSAHPNSQLPLPLIVSYCLPAAGYGFMVMLLVTYYLKFSTDVLLISPVIVGMAFGASRLWDAVTDPVVGYWSDRTNHRLGRRRPWLLFSAIPIGLSFFMAFSPPSVLEGTSLQIWVIISIFTFYTAVTAFMVPHMSLGAELTYGSDSRNKLFGYRYGAVMVGSLFGLWAIAGLIEAETLGTDATRSAAAEMSMIAGICMALLMIAMVALVKERSEFRDRSSQRPAGAFSDVFRNPHARKVLFVTFVEYAGLSLTGIMVLYVTEYVIKDPPLGPILFFVWMIMAMCGIPVWVYLSRRFKKRSLWMAALSVSALSYGSLIFAGEGDGNFMLAIMVITGFAAACGGTVGPSIQSDIIDYDEVTTGERKEGTYFACWNFTVKAAGGLAILLAGVILELSGFVAKAEQTDLVKSAMLAYMALFPLAIYLIGAIVLSRFTFSEKEHADIRAMQEKRNEAAACEDGTLQP